MKVYFYLTIVVIILAGCVPSISHQEVQATSQPILNHTQQNILAPTEIHVAIETIAPTPTPTPHNTSKATSSPQMAQHLINELTTRFQNCYLPCWFGTLPGQTKWSETSEHVNELGLSSFLYDNRQAVVISTKSGETFYDNLQLYALDNGVVEMIWVDSETKEFDEHGNIKSLDTSAMFANEWKKYALPTLLTRLGEPSEIYLSLPRIYSHYSLIVAYLSQGVIVEYMGNYNQSISQDTVLLCPKKTNITLYLWSTKRNFGSVFQTINVISDSGNQLGTGYTFSSEQAFGLTTHQFYRRYSNESVSTCLEIPSELLHQP
jgi:hypothetical protein